MAYNHLIKSWQGVPREEHTAGWNNPDYYEEKLANEQRNLEAAALAGIVKRAAEGDVAAVTWLEERRLIKVL